MQLSPLQKQYNGDLMAASAIAVSNALLNLSEDKNITDMTPMKLQKLLYYTQGWSLGVLNQIAFDEEVEAWRYGPVIQVVYEAAKKYGNKPITKPLLTINDRAFRDSAPQCLKDKEKIVLTPLLNWILEQYGSFTGIQLSNMTHEEEGPWSVAYNNGSGSNTGIPDKIIQDYFKDQYSRLVTDS